MLLGPSRPVCKRPPAGLTQWHTLSGRGARVSVRKLVPSRANGRGAPRYTGVSGGRGGASQCAMSVPVWGQEVAKAGACPPPPLAPLHADRTSAADPRMVRESGERSLSVFGQSKQAMVKMNFHYNVLFLFNTSSDNFC